MCVYHVSQRCVELTSCRLPLKFIHHALRKRGVDLHARGGVVQILQKFLAMLRTVSFLLDIHPPRVIERVNSSAGQYPYIIRVCVEPRRAG